MTVIGCICKIANSDILEKKILGEKKKKKKKKKEVSSSSSSSSTDEEIRKYKKKLKNQLKMKQLGYENAPHQLEYNQSLMNNNRPALNMIE